MVRDQGSGTARAQVKLELSQVQSALTIIEGDRLKAASELGFVQQALVATKEACRRVEEENGHLTDERLSLLVELETTKDDFAAFQERKFAERSALEAEFDASSDVILTTVMAVVPLHTIFARANLKSLMRCQIHLLL